MLSMTSLGEELRLPSSVLEDVIELTVVGMKWWRDEGLGIQTQGHK